MIRVVHTLNGTAGSFGEEMLGRAAAQIDQHYASGGGAPLDAIATLALDLRQLAATGAETS